MSNTRSPGQSLPAASSFPGGLSYLFRTGIPGAALPFFGPLAAAQNRAGEGSLTREGREAGSEQGGHPVGAANFLTLDPGIGLFHQAVSFAATDLFPQATACGGGMQTQTGRLETFYRLFEKLTRPT